MKNLMKSLSQALNRSAQDYAPATRAYYFNYQR